MKSRINSIDSLRYIAIIAVIFIHCFNTGGSVKIVVDQLTRFAVPFFFVVSGYFMGSRSKIDDNNHVYVCYIHRLMKLYFFWSLIYFLNPDINGIKEEGLASYMDKLSNFLNSGFENIFLVGISYHFWFFNSLILTVFFFMFFKSRRIKAFLIMSAFLYVIGVLSSSYVNSPAGIHIPMDTKNFIFFSSLPFALGVYIAVNNVRVLNSQAIFILTLGLVLHFVEMWFLRRYFNTYTVVVSYGFSTFLMGVGLLLLALNDNTWLNNEAMAFLGKLSLGIYACHLLIAYRLHIIADKIDIVRSYWFIIYPLIVLLISTLLVIGLKRFKYTKSIV